MLSPLPTLEDEHRRLTTWGEARTERTEDRILARAKRALDKDPHLRSSPILGEGKTDPGFFAAAALNDTGMGAGVTSAAEV